MNSARRHDVHLLTGCYAVDALAGAERAAFERHLEHCDSCAEEVRGLRETVARLGTATAIEPPPRLRERTLAAAAGTRQLPPVTPGRARRVSRITRRAGLIRPAGLVAAAAAIAVLAVSQVSTAHQLHQAQARDNAIAAVLAAPDASMDTSGTPVGGRLTVVLSSRDHEAVITSAGMPAAPGTKVYQLWVINASGTRSAGLLPSRGGAAAPVLVGGVRPGDDLGITVEPAGGTARPTTTPIVLVAARS